jgi:hypothetical protein
MEVMSEEYGRGGFIKEISNCLIICDKNPPQVKKRTVNRKKRNEYSRGGFEETSNRLIIFDKTPPQLKKVTSV